MIPVGVEAPWRRSYVTLLLIAVNVAVYAYLVLQGPAAYVQAIVELGLRPMDLLRGTRLHTLATSMFLHGDLIHLLGNMLYLYVFGRAVEARMGSLRFLAFYLACGVAASYIHALVELAARHPLNIPCVGASGAISGVLGAYLLLYPRSSVSIVALSLLGFPQVLTVPAALFLAAWFLFQLWLGLATLALPYAVGVAFWAHVGGFVAGLLMATPFRRRRRVVFSGRIWYEVPIQVLG
mgnify:CR=1 FL=1